MEISFIDSLPVSQHSRTALHPLKSISFIKQDIADVPRRRRARIQTCCINTQSFESSRSEKNQASTSTSSPPSIDGFVTDDVDYEDDVVSDDTHVVIDSNDVSHLIEQLQLSGEDDLSKLYVGDNKKGSEEGAEQKKENDDDDDDDSEENDSKTEIEVDEDIVKNINNDGTDPPGFDSQFFNAAEKLSDVRQGRQSAVNQSIHEESEIDVMQTENKTYTSYNDSKSVDDGVIDVTSSAKATGTSTSAESQTVDDPHLSDETIEDEAKRKESKAKAQVQVNTEDMMRMEPMEYFKSDNTEFMPRWVREMYESNEHSKLEHGSSHLSYNSTVGVRRLHDIIEKRKAYKQDSNNVGDDGIADCTIADVAEDYHVPIEFVVDVLISMGISTPLKTSQSIRNSLTTDEIRKLLDLLIRHDSTTIAERYSDCSIEEIATTYDLNPEKIINACHREGLYIHNAESTHLSVSREDRILDILLNGAPYGKPYPPLLEGLE